VTVEDPVEYKIRGIKQTQVNPRLGYDFALGLKAALRADPDIILIGEIRDVETARISTEAAMTGQLVFSTIHANDAVSSMTRLIDMGVEPYRVISALECVVAQRLVRRLCDRCNVDYEPTEAEWQQVVDAGLAFTAGVTLKRPGGCQACSHAGYFGRIAVQEVMVMNRQIQSLVLEQAAPEVVADAAVASGMETLRQDAFAKVLGGQTSLEELFRIIL
jgi:type II secretory ATPase GspE/PulE/Tfp pilus assembly ATPase PilB-like protein